MGSALPGLGLPSKANMYAAALEGLVQVNGLVLDQNPRIPPLYAAGVRWRAIPHDTWRRADQIAGEGWGDCEGLSAWRVAELRRTGEDEAARVGCYHTGPKKYHAIVIRGDDNIEDPSVLCGMRVRKSMPLTRDEMNLINVMWPAQLGGGTITIGDADGADNITTEFVDQPDGSTAAQIKIPLADGTAIVATTPPTLNKAITTARAASLLADSASAVAKNPQLLAKMNPYVAAGVLLYSQPEVRNSLKSLATGAAGAAKSLFKRWF